MTYAAPRPPSADSRRARLAELVEARIRQGVPPAPAAVVGHLVCLVAFVAGGVVAVSLTPGSGGLGNLASWWSAPIAFQKFAVWTLLWELLGLGGGASALSTRALPIAGGVRFWLSPGTTRRPPWPGKILFTAGARRTAVDVGLYAVAVALAGSLLVAEPDGGVLPTGLVWALIVALTVLGLRDRTPFLAARPDLYLPLLLVFAFPPANLLFAAKLCVAAWWWSRALAALDRQYPAVVALAVGDAPWRGVPGVRRLIGRLWSGSPVDVDPSPVARRTAWGAAAAEAVLPLVLLLSRGGVLTAVALVAMVAFQLLAASLLPAGAALESEAFLLYATLALFGAHAGVGADTLTSPVLLVTLALWLVGRSVLAALRPDLVSPVATARFGTGAQAVSLWLLRDDCLDRDPAGWIRGSLTRVHGTDGARLLLDRQIAAQSTLPIGSGLLGLLPRTVDEPDRYLLLDGETVAAAVLGWNLGDGRLHDESLVDAVQKVRRFDAGQLRHVTLAAPRRSGPVRYRITDAASGRIEEGTVDVRDLLAHRPLRDAEAPLPVAVTFHLVPPPAARQRVITVSIDEFDPLRAGPDGTGRRARPRPSRASASRID